MKKMEEKDQTQPVKLVMQKLLKKMMLLNIEL